MQKDKKGVINVGKIREGEKGVYPWKHEERGIRKRRRTD